MWAQETDLNKSVWECLAHNVSRKKDNELNHLEHRSTTWVSREVQVKSFHSTADRKRSLKATDQIKKCVSVGGKEENKIIALLISKINNYLNTRLYVSSAYSYCPWGRQGLPGERDILINLQERLWETKTLWVIKSFDSLLTLSFAL